MNEKQMAFSVGGGIGALLCAQLGGWLLAPVVTGVVSCMSILPVVVIGLIAFLTSIIHKWCTHRVDLLIVSCIPICFVFNFIGCWQGIAFFMLPFAVVHAMQFFGSAYSAACIHPTNGILRLPLLGLACMVELAHVVVFACALFLMLWFCWFVPHPLILLSFVLNTMLIHRLQLVISAKDNYYHSLAVWTKVFHFLLEPREGIVLQPQARAPEVPQRLEGNGVNAELKVVS